jgi:hypothetical protein
MQLKFFLLLTVFVNLIAIYFFYRQFTNVIFSTYHTETSKITDARSTTTQKTYNDELKRVFDNIYKHKSWGDGEYGGLGSGHGSSLNYTLETRKILSTVIKKYNINSMIDAPCGAMLWMPFLLRNLSDQFSYHGIDIVESIINASRIKYSSQTNWNFSFIDFSSQTLPNDKNYELIFSRDALQHLSYEKIINALENFSKTPNVRYLLVGTYKNANSNKNIGPGGVFLINLFKKPFELTEYLDLYEEKFDTIEGTKFLALYDVQNYLKNIDFNEMRRKAQL